jgi:small subunit ribosomal protein S20
VANHKSAKKRARQTLKRTLRNKIKVSEVRSTVKSLRLAIAGNEKDKALELLPKAQRLIDKLAQKGAIKKNTAARTTSRLSQQVYKL